MKLSKKSRGTEVFVDKCIENVGSHQYNMILVAAKLTRKILEERRHDEIDPYVTPVDALLEIQQGNVNIDEFLEKKNDIVDSEFLTRSNTSWHD